MTTVQTILTKIRPPRIQITYDVETEGASVKKELPFVVGVLGEYSGNAPSVPLDPYKQRTFVEIDPENFNEVLAKQHPGVNFHVANKLADDDSEMSVNLKFESMDDFEPYNIAQQVPALKKLIEARNRLNEIMAKADQYENLEGMLENLVQSKSDLEAIQKAVGEEPADDAAGGDASGDAAPKAKKGK
ncbi:MAG: type VI secretion system contractile sheath small subunit [Gammaproteobacteria bacterium]|nr:type VI secretion system contractile sheath small subunit [Gammaproteobacteria bacterium]MCH9743694.1 type VI secretion system contractile sheath small subunit [Gammaproteobacteria bacterium]